jgi:CRISPR system Cascade subunit CasC
MQLIELHILQSFPVSCLNRDDVGSPKSAVFGGVTRSRISSQALKRPIRLACSEIDIDSFKGQRSRQFISAITAELNNKGVSDADILANCVAHYLGKLDSGNPGKVKTISYYSPDELKRFAAVVFSLNSENKEKLVTAFKEVDISSLEKEDDSDDLDDTEGNEAESAQKKKVKGEKKTTPKAFAKLVTSIFKPAVKREFKDMPIAKDAADIAIFGRMVAADHNLTLEGAAMFSHALSTHRSDNELDYFSAVDDRQDDGESGAGHIGNLEFSSAVYYRYAALNLDLLSDNSHLGALSTEERQKVVNAFIRATLEAIPGARKNSMNAHVKPSYVLGTFKSAGQPVQLINAFENPVRPKGKGLVEESIENLKAHHTALKETWGITCEVEVDLPGQTLNEFCAALTRHVR